MIGLDAEGELADSSGIEHDNLPATTRLEQTRDRWPKKGIPGPLASFVGKNFDTRQDACWCSFAMKPFVPPARHTQDR